MELTPIRCALLPSHIRVLGSAFTGREEGSGDGALAKVFRQNGLPGTPLNLHLLDVWKASIVITLQDIPCVLMCSVQAETSVADVV